MLTDRNILCISVPPWKGEYAATIVELMKVLGRCNKVLYVQNPFTVKDFLTALIRRKKFPFGKALGFSSRITETDHGSGKVFIMIPPVLLTINFLPAGKIHQRLAAFNGWLLRIAVKRALRRLGMEKDLIQIVAFNPILGVSTARRFNETLLLYHCYDEIGEAMWMKKHGAAFERKFMKLADATIVTSQGLLEKKQQLASRCFLVKNAADIKLFTTAFRPGKPAVAVVGYIGSLDNRIDYDLLVFLARSMPAVRFQFIGRIVDKTGTERIRQFTNVELTGPKNLEELPAFLSNFSAGLIPFVLNEFTRGIYPLKINEYLSAGIPVVSTHFSYLDDFTGQISVAENHEQFRDQLLQEMLIDSAERRRSRQVTASSNTWENRVDQLSGIIESLESTLQPRLNSKL
ncbi:MAG: glycosyltransferase [Chitinophagaceae bacterium]